MAIYTTKYVPDTCSCVIEYTWDNTLSEANRVHTLSKIIKCPNHTSLADNTAYSTVLNDENPRKNLALQHILDNSPTTALYDVVGSTRQLKSTLSYNFGFSGTVPNRVLNVSFIGISLTTQQKNTIQSALNTRFGSGKVLIA